ncbi:MAG: SDR family NAD(P)-dependent oxidoreductase, partial [Rubrobacteraceae bacterium]|nr:SDR family NAD(P)-dependent oxidoreductase [Rubrobacteraceae bacterium]
MKPTLEGKVALVTGASSGIGEAAALELAQRGASVAVAARSVEKLEALAGRASASGGRVLVVEADVADRPSVEAMVGRVLEEFGRLDVLV